MSQSQRPAFFELQNGSKARLPFSDAEYESRLAALRALMVDSEVDAMLLTSMHNIAYYSGFLYCSFGRPYACVVTADRCVTVSANIDLGQPWRRCYGDNLIYTDWQRNNYWRALASIIPRARRVGIEGDHMTLATRALMVDFLGAAEAQDLNREVMGLRMIKSDEEIELIKGGARTADIGGAAIRDAIRVGAREIDIAMAGRDAMELEIARAYPDSEIRDSWVWFQSGINTDGAHNPVTTRALEAGDILSLNTFPMISGYYTALERTLFIGEPDAASLKIWQANVGAHELGLSLIKPGATCSGICAELNRYFADLDLLQYRTFGYGHSFGVLSHYYGREAGLELREDIDTVLAPGMVVSMEPMLTIPLGMPGAGGYREHDILVVGEAGAENITGFPYGPGHNIIAV
ncbi:MAG: aminopeptidase P family protein [Gammaproteobacteria bacterium]|nr:aminopeptidase P family protein [Gammaproteobacteria bacterium]MDH3536042.1 aminopeptidase P family protein [Gammaproteobacteria bacterium]